MGDWVVVLRSVATCRITFVESTSPTRLLFPLLPLLLLLLLLLVVVVSGLRHCHEDGSNEGRL